MAVNALDHISLTSLCPKCHTPFETLGHGHRYQTCHGCGHYFNIVEAFLAVDVQRVKAIKDKHRAIERSIDVMKRRYPLVRNGKVIKGTKGRIKKQQQKEMKPC
jgi:hypothetical protein